MRNSDSNLETNVSNLKISVAKFNARDSNFKISDSKFENGVTPSNAVRGTNTNPHVGRHLLRQTRSLVARISSCKSELVWTLASPKPARKAKSSCSQRYISCVIPIQIARFLIQSPRKTIQHSTLPIQGREIALQFLTTLIDPRAQSLKHDGSTGIAVISAPPPQLHINLHCRRLETVASTPFAVPGNAEAVAHF